MTHPASYKERFKNAYQSGHLFVHMLESDFEEEGIAPLQITFCIF